MAPALVEAQAPDAPGEELRAAQEQVRANSKLLADYAIPMATEPAFSFKAS